MTPKNTHPLFSRFRSTIALLALLIALVGCAAITGAEQDSGPPDSLVDAVYRGNVDSVRAMLENGNSPAVYGERHWYPLHYAANAKDQGQRTNDLEIARLLIEAGADLEVTTEVGFTPLHRAVANERSELREYFLDIGAGVNTELDDGWTPLLSAIDLGDADAVKSLLAEDADARLMFSGLCPLHYAAQRDPDGDRGSDADIVRMLAETDVRIDCQGSDKETALYIATQNDRMEVMKALLEAGANTELLTDTWWSPLGLAIYQGDIEEVELLLAHGADLQGSSVDGWRAMHHTVNRLDQGNRDNDSAIADLLLEAGASVNDRTVRGKTVLHQAVSNSRHDRVEELIGQNAELNTNNDYGHTPLMTAIGMGDVDMVRILLETGADPDRRMPSLGWTSLHHIAHYHGDTPADDRDITRLLIEHGADVDARSGSDHTPVMTMTWNDREDLAELLIEAGAQPVE